MDGTCADKSGQEALLAANCPPMWAHGADEPTTSGQLERGPSRLYHSLIRNYTILTYVAQMGTLQIKALFIRSSIISLARSFHVRKRSIKWISSSSYKYFVHYIIISKIVLALLLYTYMRAQCVGNMAIETKDGFVIATWVRSIGPCDGLMRHVTPWLDHSSPFFLWIICQLTNTL